MKKAHLFELVITLLIVILVCLLYILTVWHAPETGWESSGNGTLDYMFVGSNDTLYTFSGSQIAAFGSDGSPVWKLDVPQRWTVVNHMAAVGYNGKEMALDKTYTRPAAAERDGHLYVYLVQRLSSGELSVVSNYQPGITPDFIRSHAEIMAVSPTGQVEWEAPIDGRISTDDLRNNGYSGFSGDDTVLSGDIADLKVCGDRLYSYHDGREDVFATNGTLLYTIYSVSGPVTVNESGFAYAIMTAGDLEKWPQNDRNAILHRTVLVQYDRLLSGHIQPSSIVGAFDSDGAMIWTSDIGETAARIPSALDSYPGFVSMPVDLKGTLYVQVHNGLAALSTDGKVLWIRHLAGGSYVPFELMPLDSRGNFYFNSIEGPGDAYNLDSIGPDGQVSPNPLTFRWNMADQASKVPVLVTGSDGILYTADNQGEMSRDRFNRTYFSRDFQPGSITACDLAVNRTLWTFDVPEADAHAISLTPDNYDKIVSQGRAPEIVSEDTAAYTNIMQYRTVDVYPGRNVTYLNYEYTIYEDPVVFDRSRGIYVRELYALDNKGRLLWKKPVGSIKQAAVSNDTIFYSTWDGRMGGGSASLAAGIAFVAVLYLFLRVIVVGSVSRAKSRLHINENRNALLEYVAANPGSTAMEISKGLRMNLGTLRYHLLILSVNHKIVTHQDGDKYVRYFKNSGAYTQEERTLLSLLRREPVRKTLEALARKPGLSGIELSRELGISDTAAYRHVSLLVERGLVAREMQADRGYVYMIVPEYRLLLEQIADRIRRAHPD